MTLRLGQCVVQLSDMQRKKERSKPEVREISSFALHGSRLINIVSDLACLCSDLSRPMLPSSKSRKRGRYVCWVSLLRRFSDYLETDGNIMEQMYLEVQTYVRTMPHIHVISLCVYGTATVIGLKHVGMALSRDQNIQDVWIPFYCPFEAMPIDLGSGQTTFLCLNQWLEEIGINLAFRREVLQQHGPRKPGASSCQI